MPEALKRKLRAGAKKEGLTGDRADAYVYGTLNKKEKGMDMTVGEAYDKKHGEKKKKYKRGGLPKPSAEAPKGKVYTDRDLGRGGPSYEKPTYRGGGARRQRWDKTKKKWVPAPK